jgi:ribose transport system ATP-binding protein
VPIEGKATAVGHPPVIAAEGIDKRFGAVQVLFGVDFDLCSGEVHALIGENGAGKSTLMKILCGFEQPSGGRILVDGGETLLPSSGVAERLGIVMIHQELALAEHLTVEANIFLGRELRRGILLDVRAMRRRAAEVLAELQCRADPNARVADLAVSDKQLVEIAKALVHDVRVLVMDEPTAVLTARESRALFAQIDRLKAQGVAILYTSHKLDEVKAIADRVTVLRDGRHVATAPASTLDEDGMARLMVGRELMDIFPAKAPRPAADSVLEVEAFSVPGFVENASFELRRGEILGFAGLVGSGRTELMEGLMGLRPASGGIRRQGRPVSIRSPRDAARYGLAYLTEDRKGRGLLLQQTMRPNLTLLALPRFSRLFMDEAREEEALDAAIERYAIRAPHRRVAVGNLSGGNQQKLLLAKTMLIEPEIVIVDEPTRGIDIGTKQQVYGFVRDLAAAGKSVIVISSEMAEIIGLCHRVMVMHRGRLTGELEGEAIREDRIVRHATGLEGLAQPQSEPGRNVHARTH